MLQRRVITIQKRLYNFFFYKTIQNITKLCQNKKTYKTLQVSQHVTKVYTTLETTLQHSTTNFAKFDEHLQKLFTTLAKTNFTQLYEIAQDLTTLYNNLQKQKLATL